MNTRIRYQDKPWLKSYEKGVPEHVDYESVLLTEFLERAVEKYPDKTALLFQGYRMSYRELGEMVNRFAACLTDLGVKKGDRVAILLPNTIHVVVAFYATMKVGGITVMNNPLYTDRELEHQFNDSGATVLVTLDLLGNRMIDLRKKTGIRHIIYASIGDYLPFPKNLLFPLVAKRKNLKADVKQAPEVHRWKQIVQKYEPVFPQVDTDLDDVVIYQYTGGTTGVSKGVMLTHRNLSFQIQQIKAWFPGFVPGEESILSALPFFHIFGLTTGINLGISMGGASILVPKPQAGPLLETIRKFKPTFVPMVPTMYIGMLHHPHIDKTDLTSIKGCFCGSAPLPVEVIREFEKKSGSVIVEGFGMTETSPVTHINPFAGAERKAGSIGIPIPDTEARIVDMADGVTDVPEGEEGELLIRGPQVMKGYHNRPDETAKVLCDGWLHTGDIARMDEDGYFYIVDRIKDMIISGGYNVFPRDIDEALYEHPKVQEVCSIGIPHPHRGEAVKSFVVLKAGETATEEELIRFCGTKLAKYKLPVEVEFREELPKSTVGKILRKELREEERAKREAASA